MARAMVGAILREIERSGNSRSYLERLRGVARAIVGHT